MPALEDRIRGCLLGGLIGDAMGAPTEKKTYEQIHAEYGPDGVTDFEGAGTDDTAVRDQLIQVIVQSGGRVTCDEFAQSFLDSREQNYRFWWAPILNMYFKLRGGETLPVDAGYGNMASSCCPMAITPMGILNAANPRQAALETFDVGMVLNSGPTGFCRDAASAMAAAVAQAFVPETTVPAIVDAAMAHLHPVSARQVIDAIQTTRSLARDTGDYATFRGQFYADHLRAALNDPRETVPVALAMFELADGDARRAILHGANFGRDADTIATMAGGLCGAFRGVSGLPAEWVTRAQANAGTDYAEVAAGLADVVRRRADAASRLAHAIASLG